MVKGALFDYSVVEFSMPLLAGVPKQGIRRYSKKLLFQDGESVVRAEVYEKQVGCVLIEFTQKRGTVRQPTQQRTSAEIYDEYGEKFASYDSKSSVWKTVTTKAESQFQTASSSIYDEAYRAASAGKNSNANKNASSGLDVRA